MEATDYILIDGGAGTDTLELLSDTNIVINLDFFKGKITDFEVIDMVAGLRAYKLVVTAQSLIDLSSTTDILKVLGNNADTVTATGFNFANSYSENGITFDIYKNGTAELWAQQGVVVDITTPPPPVAFVPQAFSWAEHAVLAA